MSANDIHNLFQIILLIVSVAVAFRAFYIYSQVRGDRSFIIGLAMSIIALTSIVGLIGDNKLFGITYNTNLFKYIGQSGSFLFILLSSIRASDTYLRRLVLAHVMVSVLLILILLLTPILPTFPNPIIQATLSGSRALICFLIFFCYIGLLMAKETRFSLLMSIAFLLLTLGYALAVPKIFQVPNQDLLSTIGDGLRIFGLTSLLIAYLRG